MSDAPKYLESEELSGRPSLGWENIPARTVHLDSILKGELAENEFRKDFTPSERVAIGEGIERELGNRLGVNQHTKEDVENFPHPAPEEKLAISPPRLPASAMARPTSKPRITA
ncbi:hypothetical protein ACFSVK_00020 [Azorhizophilus paspali]|uniref:hypothetical protein n=1 Tax=Azorhizophilus paspali TaxID=69963 RepID=UPI003628F380